jgi:phosphate acyltransferase
VNQALTLALDAMGGDKAPDIVIRGAELARERWPTLRFQFYGPAERLQPLVAQYDRLAQISEICHAPGVIPNDMKPSQALRAGAQSSMRLAIEAVRAGRADAVVSAGNTGALMALSKMLLGTLPGIRRPAITSFFPTLTGECVMLDLGANLDCDAETLAQFALMGHIFGKTVFSWHTPKVGLLNVGAEHQKGRESIRQAAALIRSAYPMVNFHGFVEGNDIGAGLVDVVVTDGFSGNIALKTAEGTAHLINDYIRQAFTHSLLAKIGYLFARPALRRLRHRLDPRRYNGAVFLGLDKVAVKSHGGTDGLGFAAAIDVAVEMLVHNCLEQMRAQFALETAANSSKPEAAAAAAAVIPATEPAGILSDAPSNTPADTHQNTPANTPENTGERGS